jgi:lysozyme
MIKLHEGVRDQAYKDSLGKWTIGVGHLIGDGSSPGEYAGRKLSPQEIDNLFEEDFAKHVKIAEKTPGWNLANDAGKAAMIDLAFNMGYWWKKWPNTAKALSEGNFDAAANGLQDSKWYTQVGRRAPKIVSLMRAGKGGGIETTDTAVAEAPAGVGEQIGPKPKPETATTPQVAVVVPPASPTGGNAGGKKPVSKPDPNQVQRMYAQGLGMPGTA